MRRRFSRLAFSLLALLAGCSLPPEDKHSCVTSSDCNDGRVCVQSICQPRAETADADAAPEVISDAGADSGAPDAGTLPEPEDAEDADSAHPPGDAAPANTCGNAIREPGEPCDDGNSLDDDACRNDCRGPVCGDGVTQPGEDCDEGNADEYRCTQACRWVRFRQVVAGGSHFCGLRTNGTVSCWGKSEPASRSSLGPFRALAASSTATCGLSEDSRVQCWGDARWPNDAFDQLAMSEDFACGLRSDDGVLRCWSTVSGADRSDVPPGRFKYLAAGGRSACGIRAADSSVACWGPSDSINLRQPGEYATVSVGEGGACASTAGGRVICWGGPVATGPAQLKVKDVVVGTSLACGVTDDGSTSCWPMENARFAELPGGDTPFAQLALTWDGALCGIRVDGTVECAPAPLDSSDSIPMSPTAGPVRQVSVGGAGACVLEAPDNRVDCGTTAVPPVSLLAVARNASGVSGIKLDGSIGHWGSPGADVPSLPLGTFRMLAAGSMHWCALDLQGQVTCWGANTSGQSAVPSGVRFTHISAGGDHTCGLLMDGTIACWGDALNWHGHPPPPGPFSELAAGEFANCATRADGKTVCWGPSPMAMLEPPPGLHGLAIGGDLGCGLSGTSMRCWSSDDPQAAADSPIGPFLSVSVSGRLGCGVRRNGQLVCFGPTTVNADGFVRAGSGP